MRAALYLAILAGLASSSCKRSSARDVSATDLSTPETTLVSFFNAVDESRIPGEAENFIVDEAERALWKLRCETRGCKKVAYEILRVEEQGEGGATLIINYQVFGNRGLPVMGGKASEIRFERHNSKWGIVQFGKRRGAKSAPEGPTP